MNTNDFVSARQCAHEVQHLHLAMHVQRAGRFVHQQNFRLAHQGLGNRHQLLLAAAQFPKVAEG